MRLPIRVMAAFVRRDWTAARSYPVAFVLELLSALLTLTMFFFLSEIVDETRVAEEADFERGYFAFVVIGLACFDLVYACVDSFATRLRGDQVTGTLEALLITPPRAGTILLGLGSYGILYGLALGVARILMALVFFGVDLEAGLIEFLWIALVIALTTVFFTALGIAVAALGLVIMRPGALVGTALNALSVLGGVYFPIAVLPEPLRTVTEVIPLTWTLDLLRAAVVGEAIPKDALLALALGSAVALPAALWVFERSVRRSRRLGALSLY